MPDAPTPTPVEATEEGRDASRALFRQIARARVLDYCPSCAPERTTEAGMIGVLKLRVGRGFICACGRSWCYKPSHGVLTNYYPKGQSVLLEEEEA